MPDQVFWMLIGGIVVCGFWWLHYTAWRNSTKSKTLSTSDNKQSTPCNGCGKRDPVMYCADCAGFSE